MSLTTANLAGILVASSKLSPGDIARMREQWQRAYAGPYPKMTFLEPGQNYQAHSLLRWSPLVQPLALPIPFCWGPNGAFYLLAALLALYGVIVAAVSIAS